tara:strand:+ start:1019 stop:1204 length:186 start_codon:yes stop_codon:yes gene_type:complete
MKRKQRPYKGQDKKPVTEMSAKKRNNLIKWCEANKKIFKARKPNEPSIKILVGMEYKNGKD